MHGRIKTISTEEQKLKQKKARDVKLQLYTSAMARIFKKRADQEYDAEALSLTREVLLSNPDITTLWNYRREICLALKSGGEEDMEKLVVSELSLTEQCLRVNPKSYGTWHYRMWILENMPHSNWSNEVELCTKYLSLDERNFHCWDYRKTVAERANVPALDEYNFTTTKIESNFSNYSAWHFRSKLLPKIFEDPDGKFPVAEEKHKAELELVQNAAFTDPDDQSAWFYQRWLLGLRSPAVSFVCAHVTLKTVLVALSRDIRLGSVNSMLVSIDGVDVAGTWTAATGADTSSVWFFHFPGKIPVEASVSIILHSIVNGESPTILDTIAVDLISTPTTRQPSFSPQNGTALKLTLEEQLQACQELLELEPDSKWTQLTCVLIMKSLDLPRYSTAIKSALNSLSTVDSMRRGYYTDLSSQINLQLKLIESAFHDVFHLTGSNLTCLYHTQYLVMTKVMDLSGNKLKDVDLAKLSYLIHCTQLTLDSNLITSVQLLPILNHLETISLKNNPLTNVEDDNTHLKGFPSLKTIRTTE